LRRHRKGRSMSPEALWELKRAKPEWTPADKADFVVAAVVVIGGIVCAVFGL
jgi:hypothetical protein